MVEEYNEMALRIIASACDLTECEFETLAKEIAKAIAEAEARGRAAERADVVAWRAGYDACEKDVVALAKSLSFGPTLRNFVKRVMRLEHVDAAGKVGG